VLLKEQDSPYYGSPISFTNDSKYAKRLSEVHTVCVDVNHHGERLLMNISEYEDGCIPLRIDNYCNIPVFVQQV